MEIVSNSKDKFSIGVLAFVCHVRALGIERMCQFFLCFSFAIIFNTSFIRIFISQGDSGGPLIDRKNKIIGITIGTCPSVRTLSDRQVANRLLNDRMNIYSNLYYYRDFLWHYMNDNHRCSLMK